MPRTFRSRLLLACSATFLAMLLRQHLGQALGQPVALYTARDLRSLAKAAIRGDHDSALQPGHLAALLALDHGWQPLVRTIDSTPVLVLVRNAGPVRAAAELLGWRVAMLIPLSLTATARARVRRSGIPAPLVMARPGVAAATLPRWRDALLAFMPEAQRPPSAATVRMTALALADLAPMAAYAAVARRALAAPG